MRVAVCDDNHVHLRAIDNLLQRYFNLKFEECRTFLCDSGTKLLRAHNEIPFDAIFLDIEMPETDGFEVAKKIKEVDEETIIIFVTSKNDLVYDSLSFRPFQFVCKDRIEVQLKRAVFDLIRYSHKEKVFITVETYNEIRRLKISNIMYIETAKTGVVAYMPKEKVEFKGRMQGLEGDLASSGFMRIHNSYLVNFKYISKIGREKVLLTDGERLPISRYRRANIVKKYRVLLEKSL